MKKLLLLSALGLALTLPGVASAQSVGGKSTAAATHAINNQTAVRCNFCFTCGGDWPVFSGSVRSVGDFPTERSSSCSGALQGRSDSAPFLCCR
jgi:hypothetical protein